MPSIRGNIKPNTRKALSPLAYVLDAIVLTNHKGEEADIQNIVTDFRITESLYTASMIIQLNVKDTANFIEEYQLVGQETIRVKMGRHDFTSPEATDVDLTFYVTEYPVYGRGVQQNTQAYTIVGVTKQAYVSAFKKLSRSVNSLISTEIRRILEEDLLVQDQVKHVEPSVGRFNGALPLMHPLDSAYWLLRRAYDQDSKPMFLHESMTGGIRLDSLSALISEDTNSTYRTYRDAKIFSETPGTAAYFQELLERIQDLSSDFKLSKVLPEVTNGAFSSKPTFLDISTKRLIEQPFSYASVDSRKTLNGNKVLSNTFGVPYKFPGDVYPISGVNDSFIEYLPTNSLAYSSDGSIKNYHGLMVDHLGAYNSAVETLDTITHEILVAGDFNMRPGRKVSLEIPKAIDLKQFDPVTLKGNFDDYFDRTVSGKYLVTAVIHSFDSEYHCRLRIKRDSFTYDLNNS